MAISLEIDTATNVITLTAVGSTSTEDYWKAFERVRKDPRYRPTMSTLVDMRKIDLEALPIEEIQRSANLAVDDPDQRRFGRVAIVAVHDLGFGMSRMYEMLRKRAPRMTRVFRSIEEARAWIAEAEAPSDGEA